MSAAPQLDPRDAALAAAVADRLAARLSVGLLLTATEAARHLGIGRDAFYANLDEPGFPRPVRVKGGGKRYLRRELEAWAAGEAGGHPGRRRHTERERKPMKNLTSLCLSRRPGERVLIGPDVTVEVVETGKGRVRLRITAPVAVRIDREEAAVKRATTEGGQ